MADIERYFREIKMPVKIEWVPDAFRHDGAPPPPPVSEPVFKAVSKLQKGTSGGVGEGADNALAVDVPQVFAA